MPGRFLDGHRIFEGPSACTDTAVGKEDDATQTDRFDTLKALFPPEGRRPVETVGLVIGVEEEIGVRDDHSAVFSS